MEDYFIFACFCPGEDLRIAKQRHKGGRGRVVKKLERREQLQNAKLEVNSRAER